MIEERKLDTLQLTAVNPRHLDQERSESMDRAIDEFGSLDGIVNNIHPEVQELVGGNQRTIKFRSNSEAKVVITDRFKEPDAWGTMAYGYVDVAGQRWPYREVVWPSAKHERAVIAANQQGARFDNDQLAEYTIDWDADSYDLAGLQAADLIALQPDPFDPADEKPKAEKAKTPHYTVDELKTLAESYHPAQAAEIGAFLSWVEERGK